MAEDALEPNSLGFGSLVLGDRWNLLILREAFRGARRFQDWTAALGVSDPVLSTRLRDLTELEMLHRVPSRSSPQHYEYRLSASARAMWQIFVAIWLWDLRWAPSDGAPRPRLCHEPCGYSITPLLGCGSCQARGVTPFETSVVRQPGYTYAQGNPPRRYRRAQPLPGAATDLTAIELLGDRWGIAVLAAAFLGARRFNDFILDIDRIPRLMLTQRLATFTEADVLARRPVTDHGRRMEYHLTAKGLDFFSVFSTEIAWSSTAFPDTHGPPLAIRHRPCDSPFVPVYVCNACNRVLGRQEVRFKDFTERHPQNHRTAEF